MKTHTYLQLLAQATNCESSAYGAGNYDNACTYSGTNSTGQAVTPGTGFNPVDALANTGADVLFSLALGLSIMGASVILLVKRLIRRRQHQQ